MGNVSPVTKLYLVIYNLIQTVGWSYTLYSSFEYLHFKKEVESSSLWNSVEIPLKIFQTAALLEVLHALLGIVKSSVFTTAFQIFARVFVVWGILDLSPPSQKCIGLPTLILAWCITEIVRYGYYTTSLLKIGSILQWLRYSMFIILYPIGSAGELISIYYAIGYISNNKNKEFWTHLIPSAFNFGISYHYFILVLLIVFVPLTPTLYMHMLSQRRKILGGPQVKGTKSK